METHAHRDKHRERLGARKGKTSTENEERDGKEGYTEMAGHLHVKEHCQPGTGLDEKF